MKESTKAKKYDRIIRLAKACAISSTDNIIQLYPGSKTMGGPPLKNLSSELHALLRGVKPVCRCKAWK